MAKISLTKIMEWGYNTSVGKDKHREINYT